MKIKQENMSQAERDYFEAVLNNGEAPDLEGMWKLLDAAWDECGCRQDVMDERVDAFYKHPVWLLNGLFIEQHAESLNNRRVFTEYVAGLKPKRVADFGGGYGTLARMIRLRCPDAEVNIIEPHPHPAAVKLAERTANVKYLSDFCGEYDVLIATDVFEHVPDPLKVIERTAAHLSLRGEYVIANCFWPVIRCHLQSTFHFRYTWDVALASMNLRPGKVVAYGRAYKRGGPVFAEAARGIERRSRRWFGVIERIPDRFRGHLLNILFR
ncbi:MAG: methyltransferase domain-containing protein [Candidatus Pacebacteria bacterium]|nr:methyltransferase domain-containing protein [Candidatus Paceibacterota bacterium]